MPCRGIRGAITVEVNERGALLAATRQLLTRIVAANDIAVADIASVIFSVTPDLNAVCPAAAAREMGWTATPLFCVQEMVVPGSLPRCIRVLMHWNTDRAQADVHHVYLGEARALRPDLTNSE